jgi:hypothetical protein
MHSPHRHWLAVPLALALLGGCSTNNDPMSADGSGTDADDQTQVTQEVARQPDVVEDGIYESEGSVAIGAEGAGVGTAGLDAEIRPLTFWRTIRSVDRRYDVRLSDPDSTGRPTTALVTVHKQLHGTFNILTGDLPLDSSRSVVRKRLDDHWVRRVMLKRIPVAVATTSNTRRWGWRVAAISGVEITSREATSAIVSLRVQTAGFDSTVTDPLELFRLRAITKFEAGTEVTLTATTSRNDDVVVLHHRDGRFRFHNNGDNTYTGVWRVGRGAGLRHVGVNALSHGTLFDDTLPYDSKSWILPYVVRPTELAEYAE